MFERKKSLALFLLPGLCGVLLFYVVPFVGGIAFSMTDGTAGLNFTGLENYRKVWENPLFLLGLKNSAVLSLICAPGVWLLGFLVAARMNQMKKHAGLLRNTVFLPYVMPSSGVILIWLLLFDYGGPVNRLISLLGLGRVDFLSGAGLRIPVILLFLWKNLGFSVLIFLSAMQAIPESLYEYATLEGAGFVRQSAKITFPMILPAAFLMLVLAFVNAFKIFREVYFIGGAYPSMEVYTLQNYMNNLYSKMNYPYVSAAAYSFALMLFALFGALLFARFAAERRGTDGEV